MDTIRQLLENNPNLKINIEATGTQIRVNMEMQSFKSMNVFSTSCSGKILENEVKEMAQKLEKWK